MRDKSAVFPHRDPARHLALHYLFPALVLIIFFVFFRAKWAFSGLGKDEGCYLEYVHRFIGLQYPQCYSPSHFPGISILWIPAALLARGMAYLTSQPVDAWLFPFTGLVSFFCWGASLYLIAAIWLTKRDLQVNFAKSWIWPAVFLLSIPVMAHAVREAHLSHAGELAIALVVVLALVRRWFVLATASMFLLTLTRLNDVPMFLMLVGALVDARYEKGKISEGVSRWVVLGTLAGLMVSAFLVIRVGFFTGYQGIFVRDILQRLTLDGVSTVLFTKHFGMVWFMPHWLLCLGFGFARFNRLSWMARGALVWMLSVLAFHIGHAVWWAGQPQQIRYLIGTCAASLVVALELLPTFTLGMRRTMHAAMVVGALLLTACNWFGVDVHTPGMMMDGSLFSNSAHYEAGDHSSMPVFLRKGVLEPLGSTPIGFTVFSWFHHHPLFARFQSFSEYALEGAPLWILTFLVFAGFATLAVLLMRATRFLVRHTLATPPLFLAHRLDRSEEITPPFRYPVDREKVARLLARKKEEGANFPKVGILVVAYHASQLLVETLNRIPSDMLEVVDEIFVFDDSSADDTFELAEALGKTPRWKNKLKVYRNRQNLGYGGNQKVGFNYAISNGMDYVVLLHGDGQYAPELLPDLVFEAVEKGTPVVFGSRMMDRVYALRGGMPLYKWFGNTVLTHIENLVLGTNLAEFHSGYRLYATEVLRRIPYQSNTNDFHFDTQIIIQCRACNVLPKEFPIPTYYGDEICRVNGMWYALQVCVSVARYRAHQLGLLRDPRYVVVRGAHYPLKSGPYSSHEQLIRLVEEGSSVLDVGCGYGLLAQKLSEKRVVVSGVDIADARFVWKGLKSYRQVDLDRDPKALSNDAKFDCVILADVLEHIRPRADLLEALRPMLREDGRLIVSTGNVALWYMRLSLLLGRFDYTERGILDRTHVHLYTRESLIREMEAAGYRIQSVHVTSLPFEVVLQSTGKSVVLRMIDRAYYALARLFPSLFAYQFIVEAQDARAIPSMPISQAV